MDPIIRSQPWVERDALHETLYPGKTTRGLRAAGLSYRAIAGELTRLGPVNRAGGRFNHTQVVRMLEEAA